MGLSVGQVPQRREFAVDFSGNRAHFIAQSHVNSEVGKEMNVVLNVAPNQVLPHVARRCGARDAGVKLIRLAGQKCCDGIEAEESAGIRERKNVVPHALKGETELQEMNSLRDECSV